MKRKSILRGSNDGMMAATATTCARAARCAVEALEGRTLLAATTETFTGGKGPFNTTFEYFDNALIPRGISDGSETLQLTSGNPFQAINFKLRHNGGSGSVTRVRVIGYDVANAINYDNQFNTPLNQTVTINLNTKVKRLEFQPITVLQNGQQFVGSGVLRTVLDDFQYDPQVAANTPPQLTGMGAGRLGSFSENGQVSIFANPAEGINAAVQDSDNDLLTVEVQADDPDRGLLVGLDQDGDGKYFTPVPGSPHILRLTGTPAQVTTAIREVYLYFANVDDVTDTGRDYTTTFTVRINDGHNPVVTNTVQGIVHGANEAPSMASSANPLSTLVNQFTWDRDTITPFATFTVDDPDNKPVLPVDDVLPDLLYVDVSFPDANGALAGTGWTKTGVSAGTATWRFAGDYLQSTAAIRAVQFNPTDRLVPGNETVTNLTAKVSDWRGLSYTFASPVSVRAKTNTSPTLAGGPINRAAVVEGANGAAISVASLVASPNAMADVDPGQRKGVAVVAVSGPWQYSLDGTTWTFFGPASASAALVLSDATQVRLLGGDANGNLSFTYKAWDRSSWLANVGGTASSANTRVLVDASQFSTPPQNVSPFSLATVANNQPVSAVNDAPNVISGNVANLGSIAEDSTQPADRTVAAAFSAFFSDADDNQTAFGGSAANNFAGVAVVANAATASTGTWQYAASGSTTWTGIGTAVSNSAALLLPSTARIRFLPATDFNGAAPALTVRLVDDSSGALGIGTTADASVNGDPTRYSAATVATQLTVTAVNDAPAVVNGTAATLAGVAEDTANPAGATVSTLFAGLFSDAKDQVPNGSTANAFAGVAITANTATAAQGKWQYGSPGSWTDVGPGVSPSASLSLNTAALFRFLPAADFTGAAPALTARLLDNSAGNVTTGLVINTSANGGTTAVSATSVTLGTTVTELNDAPTAAADALSGIAEDSAPRVIPFATLLGNDSAGPANEASQTLTVTGLANAVGGTVSIDGTNVVFTPAQNFNGAASFTYKVQDNGTNNGAPAPLTSGAATVSFTITAVNDAPVVASLTATPGTVTTPAPFALSAAGVTDADGTSHVTAVSFYRESNATPGLQSGPDGDTLLGADTDPAGGYTLSVPTAGLAAGTYTYYAQAADAAAAMSNVVSTAHTVLPPPAPRVQAVYVNSTLWAPEFHTYLVQNGLGDARGVRVLAGAEQLRMLPWTTVNQINLAFDQDVNVTLEDLRVYGVNVAEYEFGTFLYDGGSRTARWTLGGEGNAVAADKLLLNLNADGGGVTGTGAAALEALDGEWADNTTAYPSGNGTAGGDFRFRINLLPGDTTGDGSVLAQDYADVKKKFFKSTTTPVTGAATDYSIFHDLDGSGTILALDYAEVKNHFFDTLPGPNPIEPSPVTVASEGSSSLFGTRRVRATEEVLG